MRLPGMIVMIALLPAGPAAAQEASRDRAELDAAAGRRVFENVLRADPSAFASRPLARRDPRLVARLEPPAVTGDVASERAELDAAAGRTVYASAAQAAAQPQPTGSSLQGTAPRRVRVVLPSPFGR